MITINKFQNLAKGSVANERCDYEFKGLSTDTKPTDCGVNSLFWELNTGDFYYFDGENWAKVGA